MHEPYGATSSVHPTMHKHCLLSTARCVHSSACDPFTFPGFPRTADVRQRGRPRRAGARARKWDCRWCRRSRRSACGGLAAGAARAAAYSPAALAHPVLRQHAPLEAAGRSAGPPRTEAVSPALYGLCHFSGQRGRYVRHHACRRLQQKDFYFERKQAMAELPILLQATTRTAEWEGKASGLWAQQSLTSGNMGG